MKIFKSPLGFLCAGVVLSILGTVSPVAAQETPSGPNVAQIGAFIGGVNPQLPHPVERAYARQTLAAARAAHIDPCLLLAIVSVESSWKADAVSQHGAIGLGQLKPATAASMNANPYSVTENLRATSQYLHDLLTRFVPSHRVSPRNSHLAIAAYNQGPGAVERSIAQEPNRLPNAIAAEYVRRVVRVWEAARSQFGGFEPAAARLAHTTPGLDAMLAKETPSGKRVPAERPLQVSEEQTYWGMADTSASIAHSLFSNVPDAPGGSVAR